MQLYFIWTPVILISFQFEMQLSQCRVIFLVSTLYVAVLSSLNILIAEQENLFCSDANRAQAKIPRQVYKKWKQFLFYGNCGHSARNKGEKKTFPSSRSAQIYSLMCQLSLIKIPQGLLPGNVPPRANDDGNSWSNFRGRRVWERKNVEKMDELITRQRNVLNLGGRTLTSLIKIWTVRMRFLICVTFPVDFFKSSSRR